VQVDDVEGLANALIDSLTNISKQSAMQRIQAFSLTNITDRYLAVLQGNGN